MSHAKVQSSTKKKDVVNWSKVLLGVKGVDVGRIDLLEELVFEQYVLVENLPFQAKKAYGYQDAFVKFVKKVYNMDLNPSSLGKPKNRGKMVDGYATFTLMLRDNDVYAKLNSVEGRNLLSLHNTAEKTRIRVAKYHTLNERVYYSFGGKLKAEIVAKLRSAKEMVPRMYCTNTPMLVVDSKRMTFDDVISKYDLTVPKILDVQQYQRFKDEKKIVKVTQKRKGSGVGGVLSGGSKLSSGKRKKQEEEAPESSGAEEI